MDLTVIIPVYNSEQILPELIFKIHQELNKKIERKELILVNDCSKDDSWSVIKKLAQKFDIVKGINLQNNYGQHNAIMAGLKYGKGKYYILMDDDMQHHPKYIMEIYRKLISGDEVCYVKYLKRKHIKWKIFVSRLNNIISSILAFKPMNIYTSSFKGFNDKVASNLKKFNDKEVFLDWLILKSAKKVSSIEVIHHERLFGSTNYNLKRLFELWSIMILKIQPHSFLHLLWLLLPKIIVKFLIYPFVKKKYINEQYKILNKTF